MLVGMNTLVIGGTGKTGSRVAQRMQALGLPVWIASRSSRTRFDWNDATTWPAALDGIDQAYVTFQPDIGLPGAHEIIGAFAERSVSAGTRRLVLLSGRGEYGAHRAEAALQASGADWTVLRSAFFMQNFSEADWRHEIAAGQLTMVGHTAGEPFVDADDLAEVAVVTLTDPRHIGQTYELTGPRLLTFQDVAAEIGQRTGRPITYIELGVEEYATHLTATSLPAEVARGMAHLFAEVLDGRNAHLTTDIASVLGRQPRDFADFTATAASAWRAATRRQRTDS